jgi:chaperonin cofactor prefoldin
MEEQITAATAALENPDVQAAVQDVLSQVDGLKTQLAGVYSSTYPDGEPLDAGTDDTMKDDSEPPPDQSDMVAKFFRRTPKQLGEQGLKTVKFVTAELEKFVSDKSVGATVKAALMPQLKRLKSVKAALPSKSQEPQEDPKAIAQMEKQVKAIQSRIKRAQSRIGR